MGAQMCYGCMRLKQNGKICEHCGQDETKLRNTYGNDIPPGMILNRWYLCGSVIDKDDCFNTYIGLDLTNKRRIRIREYFLRLFACRSLEKGLSVTVLPDYEDVYRKYMRQIWDQVMQYRGIPIPGAETVEDMFWENETLYLISEYREEISLHEFICTHGPCSPEGMMILLKPIMQGLQMYHDHFVLHWELDTHHIFVDLRGNTRLSGMENQRLNDPKMQINDGRVLIPSPFEPIERFHSKGKIGPWSNVYSLSGIIWSLLTGKIPPSAMDRLTEGDGMPDGDRIPPKLRSVLLSGLELKPADRIQRVRELLEKLEKAME